MQSGAGDAAAEPRSAGCEEEQALGNIFAGIRGGGEGGSDARQPGGLCNFSTGTSEKGALLCTPIGAYLAHDLLFSCLKAARPSLQGWRQT
jgi:hypothetical protein